MATAELQLDWDAAALSDTWQRGLDSAYMLLRSTAAVVDATAAGAEGKHGGPSHAPSSRPDHARESSGRGCAVQGDRSWP